MNTVNFQTRIPEELREQFRQARENAGAYSDAETLKILVSHFINNQEDPEPDEEVSQPYTLKRQAPQESETLDESPPDETQNQANDSDIVIPVTQEQREIFEKCFNVTEDKDFGEELLKFLFQMACQYVKTREGFGIFDKHERLFITKGIDFDRFKTVFSSQIADFEAKEGEEL